MLAERCQPADKVSEGEAKGNEGKVCVSGAEETCSASCMALHAVFSLVPSPKNNIHGCMAAFLAEKSKNRR